MELKLIEDKLLEEAKKEKLLLTPERVSRLKQKATIIQKIIINEEAKNYKGEYEEAPYKTNDDLPQAVKKYPVGAQSAFRDGFNNALKTYKSEATAFKVAWVVLKRWVKKHKKE